MRSWWLIPILAVLPSCGSESEPPAAPTRSSTSSVEYEQLTEADRQRFPLTGDIGCAFTRRRLGPPKLSVAGTADGSAAPQALVKIAGQPYLLHHDEVGIEKLEEGGIFLGEGILARVKTTGPVIEENIPIADESPQYPAILSINHAGQREDIQGYWECANHGPPIARSTPQS